MPDSKWILNRFGTVYSMLFYSFLLLRPTHGNEYTTFFEEVRMLYYRVSSEEISIHIITLCFVVYCAESYRV